MKRRNNTNERVDEYSMTLLHNITSIINEHNFGG